MGKRSIIKRAKVERVITIEEALSGKWESITAGPWQGHVCKLVNTDKGFLWVIASMSKREEGELTTLRILHTMREPPESH